MRPKGSWRARLRALGKLLGSCLNWASWKGIWKGRLLALARLLVSCLRRVRTEGSWKAQLQALGMLRASCLNRMGRLQAQGKLQASLQGTRAMCRAGWMGRLPAPLVVTRTADQRVKLRVTPLERTAAKQKLHKVRRGSACAAPRLIAHACA